MSEIEDRVIIKIAKRSLAGKEKYGTTMEREDLSRKEWLIHAQEEAMDLCVYLERLIMEEKELSTLLCDAMNALDEDFVPGPKLADLESRYYELTGLHRGDEIE